MTSEPSQQPILYIVYNAKSTILGKLDYAYRKTTNSDSDKPACAACELTHGPTLSLKESSEWIATKARLQNATLKQVHLDERPTYLAEWMKQSNVRAPAVIIEMKNVSGSFKTLLTAEDLAGVRKDHSVFLDRLQASISEAGVSGVEIRSAL